MGFNEAFEYSEFMIFYVRKLRFLLITPISSSVYSTAFGQDKYLLFDCQSIGISQCSEYVSLYSSKLFVSQSFVIRSFPFSFTHDKS